MTVKMKTFENTKFGLHVVGSCYNSNLQSEGTYVDCISLRSDEEDCPIFLGLFVALYSRSSKKDQFFLGRVELFPENSGETHFQMKEAVVNSQQFGKDLDKVYQNLHRNIFYKVKILGTCNILPDKESEYGANIKFVPNVRAMPSSSSLIVGVPNAEIMTSLFKFAVSESDDNGFKSFNIGYLQYGTLPDYTNKYYKMGTPNEVPVYFNVANLLRKRTGIFGKSGYGKSNTVKTVLGMLITRFENCGTIIFDTNGEYGIDNDQNDGIMSICHEAGLKGKTVLYTQRKVHDSHRKKFGEESFKPLKFDVFSNITASMEIVESSLESNKPPMYLQSWINEVKDVDSQSLLFEKIKYNRGIAWGLWYQVCLNAGLIPINDKSQTPLILSQNFLDSIAFNYANRNKADEDEIVKIKFDGLPPEERADILKTLCAEPHGSSYITNDIRVMARYADWYARSLKIKEKKKKDSDEVHVDFDGEDESSSIRSLIDFLDFSKRLYQLKKFNIGQEKENTKNGRTLSIHESVWNDLKAKKVVIIDIASIPMSIARIVTEQICAYMLKEASNLFADHSQQDLFKNLDIVAFIEEAQNYLSDKQLSKSPNSVFERLAKEGRKFHIGLVYVTQQPSAIDNSITSQTENLIVMHLSNKNDTFMLNGIKDKFDLLTCRFLKDEAQKGLAYIYAEPHQPFVLQAQIHKFDKQLILKSLKDKN